MMKSVLFSFLLFEIFSSGLSQPVVSTNVGKIAGFKKELDINGRIRTVTEFLGIPYAEDTSGQNRFRKPIPKAHFNGTFNAFTASPSCMQLNILNAFTDNMTEDCLMLNIYVPMDLSTQNDTNTKLFPVMIWIHGGAFVSGTARYYNGEALSTVGEVIVVTINYRLAEFGFLNVGDQRASGNQGLWDQHLAIRWVKNNIQAFKGDPEEITIFGESAGASSVTFQALYAGNNGLFKRAIAQSGAALSNWDSNNALPNVTRLYNMTGCYVNSLDPVDCLRRMSAADLLAVLNKPEMAGCCSPAPTLDHDFVIEKPLDIAFGNNAVSFEARQFFRSLDILTGVNDGEGALYIYVTWLNILHQQSINNMTVTMSDIENIAAPFAIASAIKPPNNNAFEALKEAILFEYVNWTDPNNNDYLRQGLMKLSSDMTFFIPATRTVEAHSASPLGHTYFYEFTAEPPVRVIPTPTWFRGANHGDDIVYVLGSPFFNVTDYHLIATPRGSTVTQEDRDLSLGMMTAWSNFAKSG